MLNPKEAQTMMVEVCTKVILTLAEENKLESIHLNIRIDMENTTSKPVFALFNKSAFVKQSDMKEIIHAGGGQGLSMIVGMYVRNVIRDIFIEALKRFELTDSKQLFILLFVKQTEDVTVPHIAIYKQGEKVDSAPIAELIGVTDNT
jgi:hypothetical protein